jgi:hypothetical protein
VEADQFSYVLNRTEGGHQKYSDYGQFMFLELSKPIERKYRENNPACINQAVIQRN